MREFIDAKTIPGSVTLVMRHGKVEHFEAAGFLELDSTQPMRKDAIFQLHSMTKPMVCAAAMQLVEEGKIALADRVDRHLPEFAGKTMTVRDLMTHTSGMIPNPPLAAGNLHGLLHLTLADAVLIFSQQPLDFAPGAKFQYSNPGIATLARIIEVIDRRPFVESMQKRIFEPLGMVDSTFGPRKEQYPRVAGSTILRNGRTIRYVDDPLGEGAMKYREGAKYPLPEGGVYATAEDVAKFSQAMLAGTKLLSRASVRVMTEHHAFGRGLGWVVAPDGVYSHGGRYGTYFWMDPKRDLAGIFMIQREGGSDERVAFANLVNSSILD